MGSGCDCGRQAGAHGAPVFRLRWKERSRNRRWSKNSMEMRRSASWLMGIHRYDLRVEMRPTPPTPPAYARPTSHSVVLRLQSVCASAP